MIDICLITEMIRGSVLEEELQSLQKIWKQKNVHPLSQAITTGVVVQEVCSLSNLKQVREYISDNGKLSHSEANDYISSLLFKHSNQIN